MKIRFYSALFALFAMVSCSENNNLRSFWGEYKGTVTTTGYSWDEATGAIPTERYENMHEFGFGTIQTTFVVKKVNNSSFTIKYEGLTGEVSDTLQIDENEKNRLVGNSETGQLTIGGEELIYRNQPIVLVSGNGGSNAFVMFDTRIRATKK